MPLLLGGRWRQSVVNLFGRRCSYTNKLDLYSFDMFCLFILGCIPVLQLLKIYFRALWFSFFACS